MHKNCRFLLICLNNFNLGSVLELLAEIDTHFPGSFSTLSYFQCQGPFKFQLWHFPVRMFTGKRPTDEMFKDDFHLRNFVQDSLPDRVEEIADPVLFHNRQVETVISKRSHEGHGFMGYSKIEKCLISVFRVGVSCLVASPRERMNISDAVNELHSFRDALLKTEIH